MGWRVALISFLPRSLVGLLFAWLFSGCSAHPLPLDTTGLNVFDVVHKIQCEAAETIKAKYSRSGLGSQIAGLKAADAIISKKKKALQDKIDELNKSGYGSTGEALQDADKAIALQAAQAAERAARVLGQYGDEPTDAVGVTKKKAIEQELAMLQEEKKEIKHLQEILIKANEEQATIDELTSEKNDDFKHLMLFERQQVVFQFDLGAKEENTAASSGTLKWPLALGVISVNYGVGDSRIRDATRTIKLAASFKELNSLACWDVAEQDDSRLPLRYPVNGSVGLDEVMTTYMRVAFGPGPGDWENGQRFKAGGESYQDKITFTTIVNAGVKPSIDITKGVPQLAQVLVDTSAKRTDTHILTIYIAPPGGDDSSKSVQTIVVSQMPSLRVRSRVWRAPPMD